MLLCEASSVAVGNLRVEKDARGGCVSADSALVSRQAQANIFPAP